MPWCVALMKASVVDVLEPRGPKIELTDKNNAVYRWLTKANK